MRLVVLLLFLPAAVLAQGAIAGTVRENGKPVEAASVRAERTDKSLARDAVTDSIGQFRLGPLTAGLYSVTVRRVGYQSAQIPAVRVAEGQSVALDVALTQAARQLSTIHVVTSPVAIDASSTELAVRLDRQTTELLPSGREASSLIALIPGARKDQLWGGAPGVSNDYQIDGVSINHPGIGGDFLSLSADWIESLEVRGQGAGAEHGNFQGGIINAITKTGTNERRFAMRTNYESAGLAASNFNANELGREQAGRREVSGEALGPIARDRLFYFAGGQYVDREFRSPNLVTIAPRDFQSVRESQLDARGLAKLTWLPALGHRVDVLTGFSTGNVDHAGINGVDDPTATLRVRQPTTFYELSWTNSTSPRSVFDVRLAGFSSRSSRTGYGGPNIPAVQALQLGRMPTIQNAAFDERLEPSSVSGGIEWRATYTALGADHRIVLGTDVTRGRWRDLRTRNGGVTWRPYTFDVANIDLTDATTWGTTGSDWGGDIRLDSDVASEALYAQDYIALGSRVTLAPGIRYGHWTGYARPICEQPAITETSTAPCNRFDAAHAEGFDPRMGIVWDLTGRNTFVAKAHWGRYHQGMFSLFFDRASGANVYSNSRFYYLAPPFPDGRRAYTTAQRDAPGSGFSESYDESILNESGRVEGYRQPYVDQAVLGLEKTFGSAWKVEAAYTRRRNGDIVGLVDRNLATNYTPIYNTRVEHRLASGVLLDAYYKPLVVPVMYVANNDIKAALENCSPFTLGCPHEIGGKTLADPLPWQPDLVLTTVPGARRAYDQLTLLIRTEHSGWRGEGSLTTARLRGNVAGVTGYGTTGTRFSAGPYVRPNESINFDGPLPDALELEAKVWATAHLTRTLQAGLLYTHILGERFTPSFEIHRRYRYLDSDGDEIPNDVLKQIEGQSVFTEPRGSRHFASRDVVDLRLEWRAMPRMAVGLDVFNVFGCDELTSINTNIGDSTPEDPTSIYGAARLRVAPRTLRIGVRIE